MSYDVDISDSVSVQVKDKVHFELLNILYKQIKNMLWAETFAATLILCILWWHGNGDRVLLIEWYGFMLLISGLPRYLLTNAYSRTRPTLEHGSRWEKLIMGMLFISALGWAFVGTFLLPNTSNIYQAFVLFLLIGVAATANPFYSPVKKIYAVFLIPTLFFPAFYLISIGTNLYMFTGIALFVFGILMMTSAIVSSNLITTALIFRFQNVELMESLVKVNEALEELATHDTLTKLPNRQFFNKLLSDTITTAKWKDKQFALMFLDIDKFKMINDTLGHDAGDQLLIVFAKRLQHSLRSTGIICRLGGDEFVILLKDVNDKEIVSRIADRCIQSLVAPIQIKNNNLLVTTSMGISFFPRNGIDEETLIRHSDIAMYHSKNNGGNSYTIYNESMKSV